jgi:phosphoglycerate dehydrogenase-like enzyme
MTRTLLKVLSTVNLRGLDGLLNAIDGVEYTAAADRAEILRLLAEAEVLFTANLDAEMLQAAPHLRWVQVASGGVERCIFPELAASPVTMTCFKGCFSIAGAEYALGAMLAFNYHFPEHLRQQLERRFVWSAPSELRGQTVGIIGLGEIGREVARLAKCFGARVVALTRTRRAHAEHVDELLPPGELHALLGASDFVVVCVPNTPDTRGMFGEAEFRAMKKTAYLIDISGRRALYDETALVRALRERWFAGANYQVQGGLPAPDSPLWELDNLVLSTASANSTQQLARCMGMFAENVRRYLAGQPLCGLVDKGAGY